MNLFKAFKYPKTSILITLIITLFFSYYLPKLVINNDVIIFLPKTNPHRKALDALQEQFGKTDGIIIASTVKEGFIYNKSNIEALAKMIDELQVIDKVEKVTSIINTDYVEGVEGGIETFPIVGQTPQNISEELEIKRRLESWDLYKNTLYTDDFKTTLSLVRLKDNPIKEDEIIYHEVMKIIDNYKNHFEYRVAGSPAVFVLAGENMVHDLAFLVPFVIIAVLLSLWFSFRKLGGVVLTFVTVIISVIWALGLMSLIGTEITLIATVIPVLLIAVGSAYGIHILTHYYEIYNEQTANGVRLTDIQHEQILDKMMKSVGKAVMLAALTTIAGFGSLGTSSIIPVRDFGIFTAVGVTAAFIVAIILIPSILHFFHQKRTYKPTVVRKNILIDGLLSAIEKLSHSPKTVITAMVIIVIVSVAGMTRVNIGNAIINFFKENSSVWKANKWLQDNTNGTSTLSIIIKGENSGDLAEPEILNTMDQFSIYFKSNFPSIKKAGSLVDLVKRINLVMHTEEISADSTISFSEIPVDPAKYKLSDKSELKSLISQFLMLFSGNVDQFADDGVEPKTARILLQMNTNDIDILYAIQTSAKSWLQKNIPKGYTFELAGTSDAEIEVNRLIVFSQIYSILSSLLIVFFIIAIFYRSILAGIYGMICLIIPLLINFGVMGFLKIPLDIATAMVSSIAIGIGIDYMIHFMSAYSHELEKNNGDWDGVSSRTIMTSGKAIIFNAVSVSLGFAVILFSNFKPLNNLGGIIFLTMATSSLTALTLLPVLFDSFKPSFLLQKKGKDENREPIIKKKYQSTITA